MTALKLGPLFLLVAVISFSGLTIEIVLTRLFSIAFWYHYAFMAISIALLGWGTGAFLVYNQRTRTESVPWSSLLKYIGLFSVSIPIALSLFSRIPALPELLPVFCVIGGVPFFFGGACVSLVFKIMKQQVNKLYFADLSGAAAASLALESGLIALGAESLTLLMATTSSIMGFFLALKAGGKRWKCLMFLALLGNLSLFAGNIGYHFVQVDPGPSKYLYYVLHSSPSAVTWTGWNAISRIDLVEGFPPRSGWIGDVVMDGGASTPIISWDGNPSRLNVNTWISPALNYLPIDLIKPRKLLIIGSGGGSEIAFALTAGVKDVTAVELNPLIVSATRRLGGATGWVYDRPEVKVFIGDGRSFIARSNEKYDLVDLRLVDTGAALSAGGYALVENYLYTVESFRDYLDHLTDRGMLFLVRWDFELPKLVALAIDAFSKYGVGLADVASHIAAFVDTRSNASATNFPLIFMIKKTPFSHGELNQIMSTVIEEKAKPLYLREVFEASPYKELFNGKIPLDEFYTLFYYNRVRSPTDDRPFFFAIDEPIPSSLWSLIGVVGGISLLYALVLGLMRRKRRRAGELGYRNIAYFVSIGVAYITIEVTLVQEFMVFLGYPTRALVTILFSLLFGSGIGSFLSQKIPISRLRLVSALIALIPVTLLSYRILLPEVLQSLLGASLDSRTAIAIGLTIPLGLLMGIPFPKGFQYLASEDGAVPFLWGINGIASVAGSVAAAAIAMSLGFGANLLLGGVAYLVPVAVLVTSKSQASRPTVN